ncbi:MAG: hypothetical protein AMJ90_01235 [candidate division Zixibacteria bacterium SM23_73_2]|nr:MAG: hypothetical protein AMJ90_01235 [candidate division Zixibacteria bacterium SM23_73_2]
MKKRNLAIILTVILVGIFLSGCFTYVRTGFGIFYRPHRIHPRYCYDCHPHPCWTEIYVECGYYEFSFSEDEYYYIPKRGSERIYVYQDYDYKKDKEYKNHYKNRMLKEKDRVTNKKPKRR